MLHVDGIEAHDCRVEADVGLGQPLAEQVSARRRPQNLLEAVQRCEQFRHILFVCFLGYCKAACSLVSRLGDSFGLLWQGRAHL